MRRDRTGLAFYLGLWGAKPAAEQAAAMPAAEQAAAIPAEILACP